MKRIAFKMFIKPGKIEEYRKRHNEIWPEMKLLLSQKGISEYSIFFDKETNSLFAFQKIVDNNTSQDLGNNEIVRKWWEFMSDIMVVNPDGSPIVVPLTEVFYLP